MVGLTAGILAATLVSAIATAVNVGVASRQWRAMKDQTESMREANRLNAKALEHARAVAKSGDEFAAQSLATAREGIRLTRIAGELDQRAWLTVKTVTIAKPLAVGQKPTVTVEIVNSGKSPAMNVVIASSVVGRKDLSEVLSGEPAKGNSESKAVIGPATSMAIDSESTEAISRQAQIEALSSGPWRLYVSGSILYEDVFRAKRRTSFCFWSASKEDLDKRRMNACARGNTAE